MVDELNFSAYIIGIMGVKYYIRSDFMIQGLKEKLEVLAAKRCWCDDDEFIVNDYAAGNIDDAYGGGSDDGEILLVRQLLEDFGEI